MLVVVLTTSPYSYVNRLIFSIDGNFKFGNRDQAGEGTCLGPGSMYWTDPDGYKKHLEGQSLQLPVSVLYPR